MSPTERNALIEKLSSITANQVPELNTESMEECGLKFINGEKDSLTVDLVNAKTSANVFAFMYKVMGDDPFLGSY